jgi:hypothetical protein
MSRRRRGARRKEPAVPDPPPAAWTSPPPAPEATEPRHIAQEPLRQQYRPESVRQSEAFVPAHAPSAEQLLVYSLQVSAEQAKFMGIVKDLAATVQGAAWCSTDGAARFAAWRKANSEAVMRAGEAIGFLVGRAAT